MAENCAKLFNAIQSSDKISILYILVFSFYTNGIHHSSGGHPKFTFLTVYSKKIHTFTFCRNMCGIWALFGVSTDSVEHMDTSFAKIKHRGPDAWKIQYDNKVKVKYRFFTF